MPELGSLLHAQVRQLAARLLDTNQLLRIYSEEERQLLEDLDDRVLEFSSALSNARREEGLEYARLVLKLFKLEQAADLDAHGGREEQSAVLVEAVREGRHQQDSAKVHLRQRDRRLR